MKAILAIATAVSLTFSVAALAGPVNKAKEALDRDCTPAKAAKRAVSKATVGVGVNRCDVGETARDTAGVDGKKPQKAATDAAKKVGK